MIQLTGICTKLLLGNDGFCTIGITGTDPFFPRKIGPWIGVTLGIGTVPGSVENK